MAAFGSLSAQDQATVLAWNADFRAAVGEQSRALNLMKAINAYYVQIVAPILVNNNIDATVNLPMDASGLVDVAPLTPSIINTIITDVQTIQVTNTDAKRQVWSVACGPRNMTG